MGRSIHRIDRSVVVSALNTTSISTLAGAAEALLTSDHGDSGRATTRTSAHDADAAMSGTVRRRSATTSTSPPGSRPAIEQPSDEHLFLKQPVILSHV